MNLFKLLLSVFFVFVVGCEEVNQNPKDVFTSGKLPKILQKYVDENWLLRDKKSEIIQLAKQAENSNKLVVAVIDNGIDVFHPELFPHLNWKLDADFSPRLGFDAVAGHKITNANLINPSLFAFGAEAIVEGKIKGELENPIEHLFKIQKRFAELLMAEIQNDAKLRDSHFNKITAKNFTFLAAIEQYHGYSTPENFKEYALQLANNDILTTAPLKVSQFETYERLNIDDLLEVHRVYEPKWRASIAGVPNTIEHFWKIEHADVFYKKLKLVLQKLDSELAVYKALDTYIYFSKHSKVSSRDQDVMSESVDYNILPAGLMRALNYRMFGLQTRNQLNDFIETYYYQAVAAKLATNHRLAFPVSVGAADIENEIKEQISLIQEAIKRYDIKSRDLHEQKQYKVLIKKFQTELKMLEYVLQEFPKDWSSIDMDISAAPRISDKKATIEKLRYFSPYYSSGNANESHGTHVASAILNSNRNRVLIEPVRPLTYSMQVSYAEQMNIIARFRAEFKEFISHPSILRGTKAYIKQNAIFPTNKLSDEQLIEKIIKFIEVEALNNVKKSATDFLFVEQLIQSIKHVGDSNILLANVSLGEEYAKQSASGTGDEVSGLAFYKFFKIEFSKFRIAKAILQYAPNTLFFIAAGNGGGWVDGHSKSALPFDLTSQYFRKFERNNEYLPNHIQKNIIGVLATDRNRLLSSFTNFPVHRGTPVISALGEDVLSAVKRTDYSLLSNLMHKITPEMDYGHDLILSLQDKLSILESVMSKARYKTVERSLKYLEGDDKLEYIDSLVFRFTSGPQSSAILEMAQKKMKAPRAYYNGTSMATPNALQASIRIIEAEAKKHGLKLSEVYGREGFRPAELIQLILRNSETLNDNEYVFQIPYLSGVRTYVKTAEHKDFVQLLNAFSSKKKCAKSFGK